MVRNYVIGVNILTTCNMQLSGKMLFRNASTLWWHIQVRWNKAITKVLLCPTSHMKFPFANCAAPSPLPLLACLHLCLHFFHTHWHLHMCFITNGFPLSWSKTSEICWHFWPHLTTHSKPFIFQGFPLIFWVTIQREMRDQNQHRLLALVSVQ